MSKIAVFYHCRLQGVPSPTRGTDHGIHIIYPQYACDLMARQMKAITDSGLINAISEFHVGVNGENEDVEIAKLLSPPGAVVHRHGVGAVSEIPTLVKLREWLPGHEDWYVFYHHIKGVTHPGHVGYNAWRQRLEDACVWGWRKCISELDRGMEACGCHWLTPAAYPGVVHTAFFGGTFWWAKGSFLSTLPPLPPATWQNRFEAETWIGRGSRHPMLTDFTPGWPAV